MVVMSTQMNGSYFRVWETLRESWDCAAKIAVSCSHGRNLEQLVDLDWFDSNFCIKSLAQIRMYQVCANPCLHKCRNPFSRNVQIQTYTGYKSLPGNVWPNLAREREVGTDEWWTVSDISILILIAIISIPINIWNGDDEEGVMAVIQCWT